ncbi:MAG: hypothetical protein E7330_08615 [Clostridiales bacterium]|nr:hypothetical protein [Clostridiales bacterium]
MDGDFLQFFMGHEDALPLYHSLEKRILAEIPDVRIKAAKTQIGFFTKYMFAAVSFLPVRKAKERPQTWLTVTFSLPYTVYSPRIDAVAYPCENRVTHHVMIGSPAETDDELLGFLREAAAFSSRKR